MGVFADAFRRSPGQMEITERVQCVAPFLPGQGREEMQTFAEV